ncbi:MAG: ABC transporter ATP-binding protein [Planctomycetaceae bacterium]
MSTSPIVTPSSSAQQFLAAEHLGLTFPGGHAALGDVSFSIARGEFISLVGPSGCGKSSLLRLLAGLLKPTEGTLASFANDESSGTESSSGGAGFVFQDPRLLPWRKVIDNIRLPMELDRVPRKTQAARVAECLQLIGLSEADGQKYPRQLSGGMRMRVSLARALASRPQLLLLDEPFGALDDMLRQRLHDELLRIWLEQKWTAVFVTHNVSEAVFLSQRVFVMSPRPGTIVRDVEIPFPYPRQPQLRADPEFARLIGVVSDALRESAA